MNFFKKNIKKLFFITFAFILTIVLQVFAADGKIELKDIKSVRRGNNLEISLKVKQNDTTNRVKFQRAVINLSYDQNSLEFISGTDATGSAGSILIDGKGVGKSSYQLEYNLKFKALQVGKTFITVLDRNVYDTSDNNVVVSKVGQSEINITPASTSSRNANLKTLEFTPGELSPEFNSEITSYNTEVNSDVMNLQFISHLPEDGDAKVTITGNENFVEGENNDVKIVVTAANGTTSKTYIIHVSKLESGVESSQMRSVSGNRINSKSIRVTLMDFPEGVKIDGYTLGSATQQGIGTIPVFLPTSNDNSTPTTYLVYGVSDNSTEPEWYRYDVIDDTLQRYYSESLDYANEMINKYNTVNNAYKNLNYTYNIFLVLLIVCVVVIVVLIIVLLTSAFRANKETDDIIDDDDDFYYSNIKSERNNKNNKADDYYDEDDDVEDLN